MSGVARNQPLEYYLQLRYPVIVYEDPDGGYVAEVPDLPGCLTQGETLEELFEMVADAKRAWIEVALEMGKEVPLPRTEAQYSGKFVVRVSSSLHRRLAQAAGDEGISLNQYVGQLLAGSVSLDLVLRRLDLLHHKVSNLERSIDYVMQPIRRPLSAKYGSAPVVTLAGKRSAQAVAG